MGDAHARRRPGERDVAARPMSHAGTRESGRCDVRGLDLAPGGDSILTMRRGDIAGGTNSPAIPQSIFAMPPGLRIRYEQPAAALGEFFTGYHVYVSDSDMPRVDWFLPATANLRITFDAGPIDVRIGNHRFGPLPQATIFGPTSRALEATTHGGIMIGVGISALGWARLARRPAFDIHNRVVPAAQILPAPFLAALIDALDGAQDIAIAPILDAHFATILGEPHRDEDVIRGLSAVTVDDTDHDIATAAAMVGVPSARLRRVALRHFGLTPKLLFRRARFLWSYLQIVAGGDIEDYDAIDPTYFDASHFLRDAQTFLGTTPRRFAALPSDFLHGSLRARQAVLGAATQALHDPTRRREADAVQGLQTRHPRIIPVPSAVA